MPILRPSLMQPVTGDNEIKYSARELRASLLGSIFSREGVIDLRGGHLRVTQRGQGANMSVDIAPGRAAVYGDDASDQGPYEVNSTTTLNRAIPAPSQSSARTHRVILQIRDRSENGSWAPNTYDADILVQPDTNAGAALPPSAIPLATVTTPANASSVTTAMIGDQRSRASVGTADLTGAFSLRTAYYAQEDPARPLRYAVNPDGRVMLAGFVRFVRVGGTNHPNYPVTVLAQNQMTEFALPTEIRPSPSSYRDFIGASSGGPIQYTVMPNGHLTFLSWTPVTHVSGQTWFSFDGCSYLL